MSDPSSRPRILLSFDMEEFDLPEEFGAAVPEEEKFAVSAEGARTVLDVLARTGVRATFFTTALFARHFPELLRRMAELGGEVASHGMDHTTFEVAHLAASKAVLEEISGKIVSGFRTARLAAVPHEEIIKAGYLYDSSTNPVWLPGRYNNLRAPLKPHREPCGLWQFPVSALPCCRFPLFWLSFKNLPLGLYKSLAGAALRRTGFFNLYTHPWEYSARSAEARWRIPKYIVRHAGPEQAARLGSLILFLKERGQFTTFREYLDDLTQGE